MFPLFELTLLVNHACNLRCSYCYTGEKFSRRMPREIGERAIVRSLAALDDRGLLDVGFFGGEPLLEADAILEWITFAEEMTKARGHSSRFSITTNGLINTPAAWQVLTHPAVRVSVSCDGLPAVHDRHRRTIDGEGTSRDVLTAIHKLQAFGKDVNVIAVVRPDTAEHLADSLRWFHAAGITSITLSLDLWATWVQADAVALGHAIEQAADVWSTNKPAGSVNWFDDSAARLLNLRPAVTQRCGFGVGQITVTPRGNLYPCERIVHEDRDDNPLRLPGNLNDHLDEINFNAWQPFPSRNDPECTDCSLVRMCGTTCRCSNFVRTGDVQRPDGLLCWLETKTLQETARIINQQPAWLLSLASGLEMGENKRARERSLPLGGLSHATKT